MSWFSALPIVGKMIGGPLEKIIDNLDADNRREFEQAMRVLEGEFESRNKQIEVNKAAAAHPSMFVAGARPFIIWILGLGFAFHFLGLTAVVQHYTGIPVVVDLNTLYPLMGGLLGLGGMRTFEKLKGVQRNSL